MVFYNEKTQKKGEKTLRTHLKWALVFHANPAWALGRRLLSTPYGVEVSRSSSEVSLKILLKLKKWSRPKKVEWALI